jgi:transcriptional antiterminator RfaH
MKSWCAVYTQAHAEAKAMANLQNQGFEVYLPQCRKRRKHARKVEEIKAPLFPRYLFVGMDLELTSWRAINSTVGVVYLVCRGERPLPLPFGTVEALQAREDGTGCIQFSATDRLCRGDPVSILTGPLAELVGTFDGVDDNERVTVMLGLLGREVKVHVTAQDIGAVA